MHLMIENKPWADDGDQQIARYASHMGKAFDHAWKIIYMPPTERDPAEHAVEENMLRALHDEEKLIVFPYLAPHADRSVIAWLDQCIQQCEADGPRRFIQDFILFVQENVTNKGETPLSTEEQSITSIVLDFLQRRESDVATAIEVEKALISLRRRMANAVGTKITNMVQSELGDGWILNAAFGGESYPGLAVHKFDWPAGNDAKGNPRNCWVGFEFSNSGIKFENPKFGVACYENIVSPDRRSRIYSSVVERFPDLNRSNPWWAAFRGRLGRIPTPWVSDEFLKFALRVERDEAEDIGIVSSFAQEIVRLARTVDEALASE